MENKGLKKAFYSLSIAFFSSVFIFLNIMFPYLKRDGGLRFYQIVIEFNRYYQTSFVYPFHNFILLSKLIIKAWLVLFLFFVYV
ncbi:hypothetical protein A2Z22_02685 [Candidatus Woesebacteria bacterium RBG_16_34_12]|uniref:Uncharacterized protein n=1 Tax=Candidatus Woesebacteria bacterium RBG_16_34_12 TaxID=1802480 RepID=A0A1F7X793_9BACT|nr:MAG: hypothetical protein A2Z22_02685 [Candidatus Woesebacteria bacterium RBG_16_34_12]